MEMVPSLLPGEKHTQVRHIEKDRKKDLFTNKLSRNELKCTFKVVQSCALAKRSFYVIKLVVRLCVDVLRRVSCYNAETTHPRKNNK